MAGNGGSAADADHICGELLKGFCSKRPMPDELFAGVAEWDPEAAEYLRGKLQGSLPAIALTNHSALITASLNDQGHEVLFAQQLNGLGREGDVFMGISTSGNSKNVAYAMALAKAKKLKTIALTGRDGGRISKIADCSIIVPETETFKIQELHLPVYHALCLVVEEAIFG